ncbi:hypothetical protein AAC387_Pa12g1920 [Persea americana]
MLKCLETLTYYNKASCGRFIRRVVLMDKQPGTMDSIGPGVYNEIFWPDDFVSVSPVPEAEPRGTTQWEWSLSILYLTW